ncbi:MULTISPECIES: hypothetical protein [Cyanophyceae]|uniref:Uncharacterized protein n=1 Tax=Leptolyngbya subtilissima DQ-A4 TaxID=2933933 RepID=A0ABV0KBZ9_9CYAN|nr:hypothetical protein [Nodosilinea sp. FACHB-141]MBD2115057.1 hypothetical protein [Nodosilinea sp. FACHB-141]
MTTGDKAKRATVAIGSLSADEFQIPNGSYRMSPTQAAGSLGKPGINARRFLEFRDITALWGEAYTPDGIEGDLPEQGRNQIQQLHDAGSEP